jgi:hypothetical protein
VGRHSAPDDAKEVVDSSPVAVAAPARVPGRHALGDADRPDGAADQEFPSEATADDIADDAADESESGPLATLAEVIEAGDVTAEIPALRDEPIAVPTTTTTTAITTATAADAETGPIGNLEFVDDAEADGPAAAAKKPRREAGSRPRSTASDVALLRAHGDVRARVIAAVLVPFALYTAAMAALGRLDISYLLWIWIPLITAGVLVGLFLDLGHRRHSSAHD